MFNQADLRIACALCAALTLSCLHGKKQRRDSELNDRSRRFVLIDARRLPEAVVHRVGLRNLELPAAADLDEMREAICGGLEEHLIFYQLVVSKHWHYYWLCDQDDPARAMTPQGDRMLRAWLVHLQQRTLSSLRKCPPQSTRKIFAEQHASGTTARAYCDGIVMLFFPDGGEKSFEARKGPMSAKTRPRARRPPRAEATKQAGGGDGGGAGCAPPNSMQACKSFGEKAFWQGIRKACAKICPAIFQQCRKRSPGNELCHQLSEYCATLKGVCAQ